MTLTLVVDPADQPALFGVAAALHARRVGARFMHGAPLFDLARDADAAQYVFRDGGLGASGLYFVEAILGEPPAAPSSDAELIRAAANGEVVVPVHEGFGQSADGLVDAASAAGVECQVVAIDAESEAAVPRSGQALASAPDDAPVPILFIGRERDHRAVYPAALASLEAAAASAGMALDIRFVDPTTIAAGASIFAGIAGILLPGGSDMANVPGQTLAARHAIEAQLPVLGLCLGMQTMTTAFAQRLLGSEAVNLAEADPQAPTKSFVAMADITDGDTLPAHRTGEQPIRIAPGTRLAAALGCDELPIRCNHRYCVSPTLRPALANGGLVISASSFGDRIVDAVEWPEHPFFMGLQGHPELGVPGGPQSLVFGAFLQAAKAYSESKDRTHGS
ncbi:glutamine amidotransferase-related protein [Mangrovicella endophytica]|uniref:glutamine amidotransferase-related protein n=1 Tax=Mangrovicella endophytica TaxID=2066697 RepID=UPI000C9E90DD|nr:gamma-glutamyl-gamma-aminobutyrate hydrolase family protein [Mangrovicella endophytica]